MGQNTKIQWAHHTQNFWAGCAKVSAECRNCYAVTAPPTRIARSKGLELWGEKARRQVASERAWAEPARWNRLALSRGVRERVFVNSLSDFFEAYEGPDAEAVAEARGRAFEVMEGCGQLDFLLLTKRPENILRMVPHRWLVPVDGDQRASWPRNVWVGTTAGTCETAAARVPLLRKVPAPVRFVSAEPLLEDVEWEKYLQACRPCRKGDPERIDPSTGRCAFCEGYGQRGIDWVIVGGESGPGARPFDISWARGAMRACADEGVRFFMKQLGHRPRSGDLGAGTAYDFFDGGDRHYRMDDVGPDGVLAVYEIRDKKGGDWDEWPSDLRVRELPLPTA